MEGVWQGDNPSGADNQQERPGFEQWVVGFVDGESCFSISVGATRGAVSAGSSSTSSRYPRLSRHVMRWSSSREYFGVRTLIGNSRHDNHRSAMWRFSVKRRSDLVGVVVRFSKTTRW